MKFNVKHSSLNTFFGINDKERRDVSVFNLLRDVIIIPIRPDLKVGDDVVFEIEDELRSTPRLVLSVYAYKVDYYDEVSFQLTLQSHEVTKPGK